MKKLLSLVLIGTLVLSLTACGNSSSKDNSSSKETTTTKKELCGQYGALCHFSTFRACGGSQ